ncbi:MAG TPA: glycosyltransferase family 4 protein [Candidatus Omnitrophota bacterium]|nr:glycosyltransferase family 4 protein [Candidatus Omnitrophota bacterium]
MRIALLAWESLHSIHVGGIGNHITELGCALERKGHEVHVFTRLGQAQQPWYEKIHGVHYHRCPFASHPDFIEEVNNMCRAFVDAVFQTENYIGAFDIVHAHDWLTANALAWIKEGRGRKAIFTIHSTEYGRCGNNFFGGNSERIRHLEWYGTYCADHVVAVSRALKNETMWTYSVPDGKIDVIYNGINAYNYDGWIDPAGVRRQYGIGPVDPMVLFVGRIVYQKGPDLLVDAIPHILKFHPNTKFVFAGDGEMRWSIEEQSRRVGVHHALRFLGFTSGWRLVDLFKATDIVCVPSRNEPFGIVLLEAWSAGKPVVASSSGGPGEIIWHEVNGLKVYPNPDSIAWGVGTCFSDFDYTRWMGRNGRVAAETVFSWDVIADEVLTVYHM